ncbi:MAG: hypothetical protein R6U96_04210 [Promethearchaeia archaeon]
MDSKLAEILEDLDHKRITRETAIQLLLSLIENSKNTQTRKKSIIYLNNLQENQDFFFKLLENLLVTDANSKVRTLAAHIIRRRFLERALIPMAWAITHESDYECLIEIIETLIEINTHKAQTIIWNRIQEIIERKYLDKHRNYSNKEFRKNITTLFQGKEYQDFPIERLAEILINYLTIKRLTERFYTVFFEWEQGVITKLDLSEIGWNVNVWRQKYAERIKNLSEIPEIKRLTYVKELNLNNNHLTNIRTLSTIGSITHLYLANNKLKEKKNIDYLKRMPKLKFLDIAGNKLAEVVEKNEIEDVYIVKHHGLSKNVNQFNLLYRLHT